MGSRVLYLILLKLIAYGIYGANNSFENKFAEHYGLDAVYHSTLGVAVNPPRMGNTGLKVTERNIAAIPSDIGAYLRNTPTKGPCGPLRSVAKMQEEWASNKPAWFGNEHNRSSYRSYFKCFSNSKSSLRGEKLWKHDDLFLKLQSIWKLSKWKLIHLGRGYFHVLLHSEEDRKKVWSQGTLNLKPGFVRLRAWEKILIRYKNLPMLVLDTCIEVRLEYENCRTFAPLAKIDIHGSVSDDSKRVPPMPSLECILPKTLRNGCSGYAFDLGDTFDDLNEELPPRTADVLPTMWIFASRSLEDARILLSEEQIVSVDIPRVGGRQAHERSGGGPPIHSSSTFGQRLAGVCSLLILMELSSLAWSQGMFKANSIVFASTLVWRFGIPFLVDFSQARIRSSPPALSKLVMWAAPFGFAMWSPRISNPSLEYLG
ncbi:hypothetical protein FNV43_RR00458 [Rhamnella rubrinervis]|uniref:Uncharacterized protein n=1 Tax=Rhamnella rubrinervis TaxID=2594499 RepID=A0A8K0HNL9_9ROSA|nr:hypothetical protein FNV43_RR00458 [Rhamnella rubrinervis]